MVYKLFVGSLSFSTSSDRLREIFSAVGTVESATVVMNPETGRSRGFGFVEMASAEEAQQAISRFNAQEVDGRKLTVEMANPSDRRGGRRDDPGRDRVRTSRW